MKIFLLSLFISVSASALPASVPMVTADQFAVGNTWFWSYFEEGDRQKLYSTERYRVVELKGSQMTFELWTMYNWTTAYTPSAKFSVDLNRCFQAFTGTVKKPFSLKMYAFENGAWSKTSYDVASTAFEEKFNCNAKVYQNASDQFQTMFKDLDILGEKSLSFQQLPKASNSQIRSFYSYAHPKIKGIAVEKTFNPQVKDYFEMRLVDWQMQ